MTKILIKRVYEDPKEEDGYRILVDRLWPRGMKKEYLKFDLWEKQIAPSPSLRIWFHLNPIEHWDSFVDQYRKEMDESDDIKACIEQIKPYPIVTLLYASKEPIRNHAQILQAYLEKHL